jgi:hypothetical protein
VSCKHYKQSIQLFYKSVVELINGYRNIKSKKDNKTLKRIVVGC